MAKDYYGILGVDRNATDDELKKAYRKLARKYHPDVSDEPDAQERLQEINAAFEVLMDPQKRAIVDAGGDPFSRTGGGGTGALASSLPICERYAVTALRSVALRLMLVCARTASASVAAEPSCRYGAVAHTSRSVGGSIPVSAAPRR